MLSASTNILCTVAAVFVLCRTTVCPCPSSEQLSWSCCYGSGSVYMCAWGGVCVSRFVIGEGLGAWCQAQRVNHTKLVCLCFAVGAAAECFCFCKRGCTRVTTPAIKFGKGQTIQRGLGAKGLAIKCRFDHSSRQHSVRQPASRCTATWADTALTGDCL
jgi:hypothetical protein